MYSTPRRSKQAARRPNKLMVCLARSIDLRTWVRAVPGGASVVPEGPWPRCHSATAVQSASSLRTPIAGLRQALYIGRFDIAELGDHFVAVGKRPSGSVHAAGAIAMF